MKYTVFCVAALVQAAAFASAALPEQGLLDYSYTLSAKRRGAEKKPGSLNDGDETTGVSWHTKWKEPSEIVCELRESCDIDRIEIHVPKRGKWHIIDEFQVAVDDGVGDFGDPVVIPGFPRSPAGQKEMVDATCTNHVFTVRNLGKAVRVRITLFSDAYVFIPEIHLFGRPSQAPAAPAEAYAGKKGDFRRLENANWRLEFNPLGGRAMSVYSKAIGAELTNPEAAGSFVEEVWDRRKSHNFLIGQPYAMQYSEGDDGEVSAVAVGNAQGGGIDFLRVVKRYSASADSTALKVDYRFENIPEAMALQNYGMLIQATLGVFGRDVTCYYPTLDGIVAIPPGRRGNEYWGHRPARGWMAAATADGTGVAVTMPYSELKTFYSWFSRVPTMEWRMIPVGLDAGASHEVATEIIPFKGLPTVSGAGGGLVGSIADGVCRVVSSRAGDVVAVADGAERALSFPRPGATAEFPTSARTVVLKRGGVEVCRLEAAPGKGEWTLQGECERRGSSVAEVDLTRYTNFTHTACRAWGRPLPGRRLKVSVLTGSGNQVEVGRLADRFDFEYRTVGVKLKAGYSKKRELGNPVFSDGDNFSLINTTDLERGIAKVLEYGSDVILVGGVPFEVFNKDLRKRLLDRVRGGTGLVWLGQDRDVPELGFRLARPSPDVRAPLAQADGFLSSVPLPLLGAELVYSMAASDGAVVHASCEDRPYVVETKLGKGRVFNVAYRATLSPPRPTAGLTPDKLRDFYETREAPVELYLSLVAKTVLAAAGRDLPLSFGAAKVAASSAKFDVSAAEGCKSLWNWRVVDPFGREIASGEHAATLAAGRQSVAIDGLGVPRSQGPLVFDLVVRAKEGGTVLNWGAWAFSNEPGAVVSALELDDPWHREGECVSYSAKVSGDPRGMSLRISLVDSYGRTLCEDSPQPAAEVAGRFCISNALPARCYTLAAELSAPDGRVVSRRLAELRVRPKEERYAWDDFEVGIWANGDSREYLWPGMAEMFHDMCISTVIANPERIQMDFPVRYNMHPTLLADAGLHRSSEPPEYSRTGDKMKLVRPTCISSPEFFAKRAKTLESYVKDAPRHGLRFMWFGDEQSLTVYGGGAVDFCFSEHCLREMRKFAKGRYGTLKRLNDEWESDFPDWDSVVPFTRQEVWAAGGRHVAGWADHLEFMDSRLTNSIAFSVRAMRAVDPAIRFALSGTQAPSAYGGMDWWKELGVMDAGLTYGIGGQYDIHRSFKPDGGFMPWKWGYAARGAETVDNVWTAAFVGARGIMGFQQSSQVNCDWTYSTGLKDSLPHIRRLASGTGMHFVNNLVSKHEVAILYSQASLRAAFIENRRGEHDNLEESYRKLLSNLGFSYDYISYEQLERGVAAERGYKVLLLVDSIAMSDAEVAGVVAFAEAGGTVVAEGMPATRRANCRPRGASPLAGLFAAGSRHTLFPKVDVSYLKAVEFPDKPENAAVVKAARDRVGGALMRAGASASVLGLFDADTGLPVVNANVYARADRAGNPLWCVSSPAADKARLVRFRFPAEAWTYDLVGGRSCGRVSELRLPLGRGTPYAFAQYRQEARLARPSADGAKITVAYTVPVDAAVRLTVFRPDGSEARCYAKNLLLRDGRAVHEIPFAPSDPPGAWKARVSSIFSQDSAEVTVTRVPHNPHRIISGIHESPVGRAERNGAWNRR